MQYYYRHTNTWHVPEMQFEAWVIYFEILSDGTLRFIDLGTALRLAHTAGFRNIHRIKKTAYRNNNIYISDSIINGGRIFLTADNQIPVFTRKHEIIQHNAISDYCHLLDIRRTCNIDGLRNLLAVVPPVEKQRDIATYLDHQCTELNSAIATNASMIEKLKEYRQSVIYEAVTGKIEV